MFLPCQIPDEQWIFTLDQLQYTPSVAQGYTWRKELRERAAAVRIMHEVGVHMMRIPIQTLDTACLFLHRFYLRHSMQSYPTREMVPSALFLACKVEESVRKAPDIVGNFLRREALLAKTDQAAAHEHSNENKALTAKVLYNEDVLLTADVYDMSPEHPLRLALEAIDMLVPDDGSTLPLSAPNPWGSSNGKRQRPKRAGRVSLHTYMKNVVQDICCSCNHLPMCLLATPISIAAMAVKLAFRIAQIDIDAYSLADETPQRLATHKRPPVRLTIQNGAQFYEMLQTEQRVADYLLDLWVDFIDALAMDDSGFARWEHLRNLISPNFDTKKKEIHRSSEKLPEPQQSQALRHTQAALNSRSSQLPSASDISDVKPDPAKVKSETESMLHVEEKLRVENGVVKDEILRASPLSNSNVSESDVKQSVSPVWKSEV